MGTKIFKQISMKLKTKSMTHATVAAQSVFGFTCGVISSVYDVS